jgi:peptidoglycan/xylan/chitin deacetylase (PgdA/CDA1 family)
MLRAPHRQRAGVVLLYHRIGSPAPDTHGLAVAPDAFERQMEWVRQRGEPLPLRELVERARDGSLPPRAMAITFDDGYADALTTVSPVLTRLGLPATFFVNTDRLNERHECWWDVLERIWSAESLPPVFEDGETGIGPISTSSAWDRSRAQRALFEAMYVMGADARQRTLDRVAGWAGLALLPRESHRPMTGDEITRLGERAGHDIGVHTIHHLALPLHPQQIQADEMARSREVLERLVGRPITALAYPYGVYSVQTAAIAGEAGFDLAVTTEPHRVGVGVRRPFVPRIEIRRSMPEAAFDLLFGGED